MRKTHGHTLLATCLRILGALGPASVYNDGDGDDGDGSDEDDDYDDDVSLCSSCSALPGFASSTRNQHLNHKPRTFRLKLQDHAPRFASTPRGGVRNCLQPPTTKSKKAMPQWPQGLFRRASRTPPTGPRRRGGIDLTLFRKRHRRAVIHLTLFRKRHRPERSGCGGLGSTMPAFDVLAPILKIPRHMVHRRRWYPGRRVRHHPADARNLRCTCRTL